MKGRRLLVLISVILAVFFAGSVAVCSQADEIIASEKGNQGKQSKQIKKKKKHTVSQAGYAASSSGVAYRAIGIGGFTGNFGSQLSEGSLERTIYDEMVKYYVRNRGTDSLRIPCKFTFSGTGEWEESDEYKQVEEDLGYSVETAYSALVYDYPELFWIKDMNYIEDTTVSVTYKGDTEVFTGSFAAVAVGFTEIYSGASKRQAEFSSQIAEAKSIIMSRRTGTTAYDTLRAIHDYVCEKILYPAGYDLSSSAIVPAYHSAAGVFLDGGVAVCEGYAKSFMILCREFNIPAILVVGDAGEAHMWNYVQLNGSWYAVDTTWDDIEGTSAADTYFMVGSETEVPGGTFGSTRVLNTRFTESGNSRNFNYPILNSMAYRNGELPCSKTRLHSWVTVSETEPTCESNGKITYRCSRCGETTSNNIAALGHSYHDKNYIYNNDATVFKNGTKKLVCDHGCGTVKETVVAEGTKLKPTITVNVNSLKLKKGQSTNALMVSGLAKGDAVKKWQSTDTSIVKVSATGRITAQKKTGTAKIKIVLKSGLKKTVKVTVQEKAVITSKISGVAKSIILEKGKTTLLTPVLSPITSVQKVSYKSLNKKIATVSSGGKVMAKQKGETTVTVKSGSKTIECKIIVY